MATFFFPYVDKTSNYHQRVPTQRATKDVLAANLNRLMATYPSLDSNPKLAKKAKLGVGTIARTRNADAACSLDTLDKLAGCFELQSWQMLVPDLDPKSPPVLRSLSQAEHDMFERLRAAIKQSSNPANG